MKLSNKSIALACMLAATAFSMPARSAPAIAEGVDMKELFVGAKVGPRTRAEVRDELNQARAAGTLTPTHEIGDTQEVLDARETFAELQREVVSNNRALLTQREQRAKGER
ncbi:MAG: DUF4148 domain-containing protein [Chitinophagaceae bacterium]|nr:DUF4148 domain-containing protein [Rubrivivax sp.]